MATQQIKRTAIIIFIIISTLVIITILIALTSNILLPKMIVKKAIKNEKLTEINEKLQSLEIEKAEFLNTINKLKAKDVKNAISYVNEIDTNDALMVTSTFVNNLGIGKANAEKITNKITQDSSLNKSKELILLVLENKNKIPFVFPVVKNTIKEVCKQDISKK
ncbi:MAG: hypothetical protein U9R42_09440 [Bacteroidota bacterium]|nr:hypothetical protein [Bacteroidota bacterium]